MFWGTAILVMFLLYITSKGELPVYMAFFRPQPNTSDNSAVITPAQAAIINARTIPAPFGGTPLPNPFPVQPNSIAIPPFVPPENFQ